MENQVAVLTRLRRLSVSSKKTGKEIFWRVLNSTCSEHSGSFGREFREFSAEVLECQPESKDKGSKRATSKSVNR